MQHLSDPKTQLSQFFRSLDLVSSQVAPVAQVQAELFKNMADTFAAFNRCQECLRQTIEKGPPTEDTAIASFRVQTPFLHHFAEFGPGRVMPQDCP